MIAPLTLRPTVIASQRYADDYGVIWQGMAIGRIFLGSGAPHDRPRWSWSRHLHGGPQASNERGVAVDLDDAKRQFKVASSRIRAGLTETDIAKERRIAEISSEALGFRQPSTRFR